MKYIMKALIDGVVSIVKLVVVLYALWWCYDTGIVSDIINYFKQYGKFSVSICVVCLCLCVSTLYKNNVISL